MAMKDRELSRYQEELRSSELQRVNNEKNYTKIFSTYSSRRVCFFVYWRKAQTPIETEIGRQFSSSPIPPILRCFLRFVTRISDLIWQLLREGLIIFVHIFFFIEFCFCSKSVIKKMNLILYLWNLLIFHKLIKLAIWE